jgi:hypothetical protein
MQSLVFQRLDDPDRLLAFRPDGSYIFRDNLPFVAYEPVPRQEKNSLHFYLLVAVLVLFLSALGFLFFLNTWNLLGFHL